MPLPPNGSTWPPNHHAAGLEAMSEWSAWYSGDPDQLATHYQTAGAVARPAQYSGGVVGAVARWWWGQPEAPGESRSKLHVPLAADIAGTSADMLFSDPVKLTSDTDSLAQHLETIGGLGLHAQLHEAAEVAAALGGTYLRTTWDSDVSDLPWLDAVQPDGALPEFRHGRFVAVTLWTQLPEVDAGVVHRLLERHESGAIEYALYAGTATNLGRRVPLPEHPDSEGLAVLVDETGVQLTGVKSLTATYVPNMLPNRAARRSHLGRSDFQGVTPLFDALDESYSSWLRDIRHAKSRIHVPASYLESGGPGTAAMTNLDREVYVPLEGVLARAGEGMAIDVQQFKIRHEEHAATCRDWANRAVQAAGYSVSTFGEAGENAATATEIRDRQRRSYMTRGKKVRYWTLGLTAALQNVAEISNATPGLVSMGTGSIGVEFSDGVQESPTELAQTAMLLRNAEAASVATRVSMIHPDWDKETVDAEVNAIMAETGAGAPVPNPDDAGF